MSITVLYEPKAGIIEERKLLTIVGCNDNQEFFSVILE